MKTAVPKNADPYFRPKLRQCGKCGRPFTTTPLRRYLCAGCFTSAGKHSLDVPTYRMTQ